VRWQTYALVYLLLAMFMVLSHGPLLQVPFYWDETGQFIPAALDLYHSGAVIPHSTLPNVHPPGVMAYLAAFWHLVGFSISHTRIAMLLLASFGALVTFLLAIELGREATGTPAFSALAMLCLSPLFFAQSMLAQLDMPAMCFSLLALLLFLQDRYRDSALACVALVLMKETGLATAGLFGAWLLFERKFRDAAWFLLPASVLGVWLLVLRSATGHWFGNAEFTQYNLFYPLNPVRFTLALLRRVYYLFAGTGHFIGTAILLWAFRRTPIFRSRPSQTAAAFVGLNVLAVSALGGAVLERYLLPVLPVVYIAFAIAIRALVPVPRKWAVAALIVCLAAANLINPVYSFPFENNLQFVSFTELEQDVAADIDLRPGTIATTFPLSDALRHPEYGYVNLPRQVIELKDFRASDLARLQDHRPDMMVVYSTAWDPLRLLERRPVRWLMRNFYNFEPALSPEGAARLLSMRVVRRWEYRGVRMALLTR